MNMTLFIYPHWFMDGALEYQVISASLPVISFLGVVNHTIRTDHRELNTSLSALTILYALKCEPNGRLCHTLSSIFGRG
jgi:hypothetical protein